MEQTVVLTNGAGLHARPASLIAQTAMRFKATVTVKANAKQVNAKSMLSLLSLGAKDGDEVTFAADGADAAEAVSILADLARSLKD